MTVKSIMALTVHLLNQPAQTSVMRKVELKTSLGL